MVLGDLNTRREGESSIIHLTGCREAGPPKVGTDYDKLRIGLAKPYGVRYQILGVPRGA